jgi:hypothetical protein
VTSSKNLRLSLNGAVLLFLGACTRTYFPTKPQHAFGPRINAVVDRVSIGFASSATVELRSGALPNTSLRGARLASLETKPCTTGVDLFMIERDGTVETEGPVDLGGSHELRITFGGPAAGYDPAKSPLLGSAAVDLEIESPDGRACLRLPLAAAGPERVWKPDPRSAGLLLEMGGRFYPLSMRSNGVEPVGSFVLRLGGGSESARGFAEMWGGSNANDAFRTLGLAAGGDRTLWSSSGWSMAVGLAYDAVFVYRMGPQPAPLEYVLHGPRLTPSLMWAPFSQDSRYPGFPLGRRTVYFELEMPVSGWFGTRGAPAFTFVPGAGFHVAVTL